MPLVSYWPLDEDSGSTATDVRGENDGTINGATLGAEGVLGTTAYSFDGTDDYVDHGDVLDLTSDHVFSVSAWVKLTDDSTGQAIVSKTDSGDGFDLAFNDADDDGDYELIVYISNPDGSGSTYVYSDDLVPDGNWHHIVWTQEGTGASNVTMYADGGEISKTVINDGVSNNFTTTNTFYIGARHAANVWYANGIIDDVRIYDHALTPQEVQYLYETSQRGKLTTSIK